MGQNTDRMPSKVTHILLLVHLDYKGIGAQHKRCQANSNTNTQYWSDPNDTTYPIHSENEYMSESHVYGNLTAHQDPLLSTIMHKVHPSLKVDSLLSPQLLCRILSASADRS